MKYKMYNSGCLKPGSTLQSLSSLHQSVTSATANQLWLTRTTHVIHQNINRRKPTLSVRSCGYESTLSTSVHTIRPQSTLKHKAFKSEAQEAVCCRACEVQRGHSREWGCVESFPKCCSAWLTSNMSLCALVSKRSVNDFVCLCVYVHPQSSAFRPDSLQCWLEAVSCISTRLKGFVVSVDSKTHR